MKNQILFSLLLFLNAAVLAAQNTNQTTDDNSLNQSSQESSPLMILREGDEKSPQETRGSLNEANRRATDSENEERGPLDHSNVSDINGELGIDIRGHVQTIETIKLAEDLSGKSEKAEANFKELQKNQKLERRKMREQKKLAAPQESDTDGYLTTGTFLKRAVLKTAQAEVATSLLQTATSPTEIKKLSAAERDVEDFTRIAEEKRTEARKASLAATKIKKAASSKIDLDQEKTIYTATAETWSDTIAAYQAALKKALKATIETKELTNAMEEARAHLLYWQSALLEVSAKEKEQESSVVHKITLHEAETLESAWHEALEGYQKAITQAETLSLTDEAEEWSVDLAGTESKKSFWTTSMIALEDKLRNNITALQINAKELTKEAAAAAAEASKAADTIEAEPWNVAMQKAEKAQEAWGKFLEACQIHHDQTLERFKEWWIQEIKKIRNTQESFAKEMNSWNLKKEESVIQAQEEECRSQATALQTKAQQLTKEAAEAAAEASRASDTLEAAPWNLAIQKGVKAQEAWEEVSKTFQTHHDQTLERFKKWWIEEINKIRPYQNSLNHSMISWKLQKEESMARADQVQVNERVAAIRHKICVAEQEIERQQEIERVAHSNVTIAELRLQQADEAATATAAKIREAQEKSGTLSASLRAINARIQNAHERVEFQKYSFRNFVGISHSKRDAMEDKNRAESEAARLQPFLDEARATLAKLQREAALASKAVSQAKIAFTQTTSALTQTLSHLDQSKSKLANLQQEEEEAIRWASLTTTERAVVKRAAIQEILRWNHHVDEATEQARRATQRANERYEYDQQKEAKEAADEAVIAWQNVVDRSNAAAEYWRGILQARKADNSPFQLVLSQEAINNEIEKWENKKTLSEIKVLAVAYYDRYGGWDTWFTHWNRIQEAIQARLWNPSKIEILNQWVAALKNPSESLENKEVLLSKIRATLYHFSNAYAYANANAYVYAYDIATAHAYDQAILLANTFRTANDNPNDIAYANATVYATAYTTAYVTAYATAYIYGGFDANTNANAIAIAYAYAGISDNVEEATRATTFSTTIYTGIRKTYINCFPRLEDDENRLQIENQLQKIEEVAQAIAAFHRAEERFETRKKPAAVAELEQMATTNSDEGWTKICDHFNAVLTKVKNELWPGLQISMTNFATTSIEEYPVVLERIRGELMDAGFIVPAAALSPHASIDQPAETAESIRAQAQAITIADLRRWLSSILEENLLFQRTQLLEIAHFLDQVATYRKRLEEQEIRERYGL